MTLPSPNGKKYLVAVAGIMGSGKTTACNLLGDALGFKVFEENFGENAFLPLFYNEPARWSFHSQLFFLREKLEQLSRMKKLLEIADVVHDSPIYQDYLTYAKAQHHLGHMNDHEFDLYGKIFHAFHDHLVTPDLIIQLDASLPALKERIQARDRAYERTVDDAYLSILADLQARWINENPHLNILRVDTDNLDLAANKSHQKIFIESVQDRLGRHR